MSRILMTWELGSGLGHLTKLTTLATALQAVGHEVACAVRDPGNAAALLKRAGLPFYQCPVARIPAANALYFSLPQILLAFGYAAVPALKGRLDAWRAFYSLLKPDVLVCDASPTALLASRGRSLRTLAIGTGFFMPPDSTPLPSLRPWVQTDPDILAREEAQLLENINAALSDYPGVPPLHHSAEAFTADQQTLMTLRELDVYAPLRTAHEIYWGPAPTPPAAKPEWPTASGKRVFVYLRHFNTLPDLLTTLKKSDQATLLYIPNLPKPVRDKFAGGNMLFSDQPLDMRRVAEECDLAVLHGGHGATALMLLAGKPMLLLPVHLEMLLNSLAVAEIGAGLLAPQLRAAGMREKFERLLQDPAFGAAAQTFAGSYASLDISSVPARVAGLVGTLLAS